MHPRVSSSTHFCYFSFVAFACHVHGQGSKKSESERKRGCPPLVWICVGANLVNLRSFLFPSLVLLISTERASRRWRSSPACLLSLLLDERETHVSLQFYFYCAQWHQELQLGNQKLFWELAMRVAIWLLCVHKGHVNIQVCPNRCKKDKSGGRASERAKERAVDGYLVLRLPLRLLRRGRRRLLDSVFGKYLNSSGRLFLLLSFLSWFIMGDSGKKVSLVANRNISVLYELDAAAALHKVPSCYGTQPIWVHVEGVVAVLWHRQSGHVG